MELGSVSDWVSAGCNAVMAGTAVYAAWKAPKWIDKRKHENAYDIAKKIILDDLPELKYKIESTTDDITFLDTLINNVHAINGFINSEHCEYCLSKFRTKQNPTSVINKKLRKLQRLGWSVKKPYHLT
ncbi:hypothetical protein ABC733_06710 [Mangrovibacter sp. SLW1]